MAVFAVVVLIVCGITKGADQQIDWLAVGDDDMVGVAAGYEMVWSLDSAAIVASDFGKSGWNVQPGVTLVVDTTYNVTDSLVPGTQMFFVLTDLPEDTTVFVSVKARDERWNYGVLGNIRRFVTPDVTAPAAVIIISP